MSAGVRSRLKAIPVPSLDFSAVNGRSARADLTTLAHSVF
jgi:hypothetical protein